ncbi:peptidoglycan D,D-transpeptidase FtsI family protein [Henriciella marina]|uniref:Penicillin-binding protein 2 n=1 Tax=Henriciella marina TaxID=453851 RepID=A0ABT4LYL5_9PROT|nr:penicillin-binding protein 2 [Henriciella marina]MCZ4298608.1 penicillin-binding protein 2 [Henriciella marina]
MTDRLVTSEVEGSALRARLVSLALCAGFFAVSMKAGFVALAGSSGQEGVSTAFEEPARRADIVDRNGVLLATSVNVYSLFADPRAIWEPEVVAAGLVSVLPELDVDTLTRRLSDNERAFVWIKRGLTPRQHKAVFDLNLEGLGFREESRRVYPRKTLAGHVLGYAGTDGQGLAGVEYALDAELADGGQPLRLTIDSSVQHMLESELSTAATEYEIEGGAGVVLNARNGEVLGLASWPPIDPNRAHTLAGDDPARANRAVNSVFELGSVFKPITVAAGIDTGAIRPSDTFDVEEPIVIAGRRIGDTHRIPGPISPAKIVSESSNIGTVKVALMLGARRQQDILENLGLFERSPIELAGSADPILPSRFDDIHAATVSYGHGIAVSPIAFAGAFSMFANSGEVIEPTILANRNTEREVRRVVSAPTASLITHMLREAVVDGTGGQAEVAGYRVAGKTGTAEKPVAGGYANNANIASFAAVFPADSPEYVVLIVLDSPKADVGRGRTAAWNAAPTAGRVINRVAPSLGVEPSFDDYGPYESPLVRSVAERRSTL